MSVHMSIHVPTAENETGSLASDGVTATVFPQKLTVEPVASLKVVIRTADLSIAEKPGALTVCMCLYTHIPTHAYVLTSSYMCPYTHSCLGTIQRVFVETCLYTCPCIRRCRSLHTFLCTCQQTCRCSFAHSAWWHTYLC